MYHPPPGLQKMKKRLLLWTTTCSLLLFSLSVVVGTTEGLAVWAWKSPTWTKRNFSRQLPRHYASSPTSSSSADVVIVGAGASGLFASGAAAMLGQSVALIDTRNQLGGDCTNAACVPSKALRSVAAQLQQPQQKQPQLQGTNWEVARDYLVETVQTVRQREDPKAMEARSNGKTTVHVGVQACRFVNPHELKVIHANGTAGLIRGRTFVIATGAAPIVPQVWKEQAMDAQIPLFTYQTVLRPESNLDFWSLLNQTTATTTAAAATTTGHGRERTTLAIVGGGATACELGQSLARLAKGSMLDIKLIAKTILPLEDPTLRQTAKELLLAEGIEHVPSRLVKILPNQSLLLEDHSIVPQVDLLLICIGRSPQTSLQSLDLDKAGVAWTANRGVTVHPWTLRSTTTTHGHFYAVGDCSSAVPVRFRTASHAGWMGFHAIRNAVVPWFFRFGSRTSVHPCVPRVIYTDPEMACVGMTQSECCKKYGDNKNNKNNNFDFVLLDEDGSDRADIDRTARNTSSSFLELRAAKGSGRILGLTCCGPTAAEMANTIGLAITNRLTVRDVARSLHSYPSYGYLLHRVALSMALSDVWGVLQVCGPVAGFLARIGRGFQMFIRTCKQFLIKTAVPCTL